MRKKGVNENSSINVKSGDWVALVSYVCSEGWNTAGRSLKTVSFRLALKGLMSKQIPLNCKQQFQFKDNKYRHQSSI